MDNNIKVTIWGKEVGRLTWDVSRKRSIFEYAPSFLKGELDIAPLTASIHDRRSRLPFYGEANNGVFYGLPAFISDHTFQSHLCKEIEGIPCHHGKWRYQDAL